MKTIHTLTILVVGLAVGLGAASGALAQGFPTKPVRVIVPYTAGSGIDVLTRIVSEKLTEFLGRPVLVENRTGAGGTVGTGVVAKSPPDGHTLLATSVAYALNLAVYPKLSYNAADFLEVAPLASSPYVLVAGPGAGVRTVRGLIEAAKAKPGTLNFGSAGIGTGTHFAGEKFRFAASIDVVHIPYKGGPEANTDTMTGRITYWLPPIPLALPLVREGRLIALAVSSAQRSSLLPEVPTIAEAGVNGFEDSIWYGVWAPAGTPAGVVDKIAKDIARALEAPDVRDRLTKLGAEPMRMTSAEFASFVKREIDEAARIVKAAGIKLE